MRLCPCPRKKGHIKVFPGALHEIPDILVSCGLHVQVNLQFIILLPILASFVFFRYSVMPKQEEQGRSAKESLQPARLSNKALPPTCMSFSIMFVYIILIMFVVVGIQHLLIKLQMAGRHWALLWGLGTFLTACRRGGRQADTAVCTMYPIPFRQTSQGMSFQRI
jgi:hypothetical protein